MSEDEKELNSEDDFQNISGSEEKGSWSLIHLIRCQVPVELI